MSGSSSNGHGYCRLVEVDYHVLAPCKDDSAKPMRPRVESPYLKTRKRRKKGPISGTRSGSHFWAPLFTNYANEVPKFGAIFGSKNGAPFRVSSSFPGARPGEQIRGDELGSCRQPPPTNAPAAPESLRKLLPEVREVPKSNQEPLAGPRASSRRPRGTQARQQLRAADGDAAGVRAHKPQGHPRFR